MLLKIYFTYYINHILKRIKSSLRKTSETKKLLEKESQEFFFLQNYLRDKHIEKFKNIIDWKYLSKYQPLSKYQIYKYKDRLSYDDIVMFQKLPIYFIEENIESLNIEDLKLFQNYEKR